MPIEDSLTPEDYSNFIRVDMHWIALMFIVVLSLLGGLLYWYSLSARGHSDLRVTEAEYLIDRGDTAPGEITPVTLELEELVAETARDRDWIFQRLGEDRRAGQLEEELQSRFLQETFHWELPDDWQEQLPEQLNQWYQQELTQRQAELDDFLNELSEFLAAIRQRAARAKELRQELEPGELFADAMARYELSHNNLLTAVDRVEQQLPRSTDNPATQLDNQLFSALVELPRLLLRQKLQYRRLSALSAAPASYIYAERYLRDALRIFPRNPEAFYQLGRVYQRLELPILAGEHYARAIQADPGFERTSEIIELLEQRIEEDPDNPRLHYDLGFALQESGALEEAREVLETAWQMEAEEESMLRVLIENRLGYVEDGVSIYHRMRYF